MTIPLRGVPLSEHREWLEELADLGYTDLWTAEVSEFDALTPLAAAAAWAPELRTGSAIASVFSRGPALLAMEAAALADLAPGRFVLGIGSSSDRIVEGWNDRCFEKPYQRVRDVLRFLRRALAGERIDEAFETFEVKGFALDRPPKSPPPIFVAALRESMLRLAGREANGVLLGLVSPDDVERQLKVVRAGGRNQEVEVVIRLGVTVTDDVERARNQCRRVIAAYLNVSAYAALHDWLGRGELLRPMQEAWRAGDRKAAVAAVPDNLIDAFFVNGPAPACRDQIQRFLDAGVTTPLLSVSAPRGDLRKALRDLSPSAG